MMKKIGLVLVACLLTVVLIACGQTKRDDGSWLKGKWQSKEWDVTYVVDEKDDKWSITTDKGEVVGKDTKRSVDGKETILMTDDGIEFHFTKVDEKTVKYQQTAPDGIAGTTAVTELKKVE